MFLDIDFMSNLFVFILKLCILRSVAEVTKSIASGSSLSHISSAPSPFSADEPSKSQCSLKEDMPSSSHIEPSGPSDLTGVHVVDPMHWFLLPDIVCPLSTDTWYHLLKAW